MIETCKLNGIEPLGYLTDVLTRIVDGHPNSRIDESPAMGLRQKARPQGRGLIQTQSGVRSEERLLELVIAHGWRRN
ncbi:hypothetical protein GCM10010869_07840 [Mesorhizobium tianshanense]|uniref:Transposase IS66-like protein n=1 Tax=Mesorhizobium tianshanense TaxID=39844 RepID=A0A562MAM8_9HYPH|nr:transposase IS66-like protein [Mesorhizobium tianshanense]GLS35196.1 hypothetical protein GCM10010869_07840 [Mesorhizobium tianshanense]